MEKNNEKNLAAKELSRLVNTRLVLNENQLELVVGGGYYIGTTYVPGG